VASIRMLTHGGSVEVLTHLPQKNAQNPPTARATKA
jgi:hypothetical protein